MNYYMYTLQRNLIERGFIPLSLYISEEVVELSHLFVFDTVDVIRFIWYVCFDYCNSHYYNIDSSHSKRMQIIQNALVCAVTRTSIHRAQHTSSQSINQSVYCNSQCFTCPDNSYYTVLTLHSRERRRLSII